MIPKFVEAWEAHKGELRAVFEAEHPASYDGIFASLVQHVLSKVDAYEKPDPARITAVDHGDYQGTRCFVVAGEGYQPSSHWGVSVSYGSCSGCDTFEALREYSDDPPRPDQVEGYMTLALHFVQELKEI